MKTNYLLLVFALSVFVLTGCTDNCKQVRTYRKQVAVQITLPELRTPIASATPQSLVEPGKIYVKDNYLFIIEVKKGIHVIDNANPASPRFVSFVPVPGNVDLAVVDNILYVDSYIDLVALDISNPAAIKEVGRTETGFTYGSVGRTSWSYNNQTRTVTDYKEEITTETIQTDCEGNVGWFPYVYAMSWFGRGYLEGDFMSFNSAQKSSASPTAASTTGTGGSMARFTIMNNQLYVVNQSNMQLFDISNPVAPAKGKTINLGWGIETIFPYQNKLFIGAQDGMHIYDASDPANPKQLSVYRHVRSCDPVVVSGDYAYVTLRGGGACGGTQNVLDIVSIADPTAPTLVKSYPMDGPYGLGIDSPTLFICEGLKGLKVFKLDSPTSISPLQTFTNVDAYDVIPLAKTLMLVGKDGLYQYDYSNSTNLRQLSKIAAQPPF